MRGRVFSRLTEIQVADSAGNKASAGFSINVSSASQGPFGHIVIVLEENTDYLSVVGTTAMPYLNTLISQYGLATQWWSSSRRSSPLLADNNLHPSWPVAEVLAIDW